MGTRYRNAPPWMFFFFAAPFLAMGVAYLVVGVRGKKQGAYSVQLPGMPPSRANLTPGGAIARGVLSILGAGFLVFLGYAFN